MAGRTPRGRIHEPGPPDVAWIRDTADEVAHRHVITARTVRGWLSTGRFNAEMADALASLADQGIGAEVLNAMVYAMGDRPIGDLPALTEDV